MSKRLFSSDRTSGITEWFTYDETNDKFSITVEQDVSVITGANRAAYNNVTSLDRWGDGKVVARVPLSIYTEWIKTGKDKDDAFLRRFLNDPDNRAFRVRPGKI